MGTRNCFEKSRECVSRSPHNQCAGGLVELSVEQKKTHSISQLKGICRKPSGQRIRTGESEVIKNEKIFGELAGEDGRIGPMRGAI